VAESSLDVILLEPFFKGSHAAWAEGYRERSRHRVRILALEGLHWKWRLHHSALHFAEELAARHSPPDVLVVSSMTDAAALQGLLPPPWPRVPLLYYLHENQLTYPLPPGERRDLHYAWIQVASCAAARACAFNSRFHMEDFLGALPDFLGSFPDHRPFHLAGGIRRKSRVIHPGVDTALFSKARESAPPRSGPLRILWNHRWEEDKEPGDFLEVLAELSRRDVPFRVILAGPGSDDPGPAAGERIRALGERVIHTGYASKETYPCLLASADVLVSTARHDFFGMSVVEGMAAGLLPLLPKRQNYPHLLPEELKERCLWDGLDELAGKLAREAAEPESAARAGSRLLRWARRFDIGRTAEELDSLVEEIS